MAELLGAINKKDSVTTGRISTQIASEGRREYLQPAHRANTPSNHAYLSGAGCRRQWGADPTDLIPTLPESRLLTRRRDTGEAIALDFHRKPSAPWAG